MNCFVGFFYMLGLTVISRGGLDLSIKSGMLFVLLYNAGRLLISFLLCRVNFTRHFILSNFIVSAILCLGAGMLLNLSIEEGAQQLLMGFAFVLGTVISFENIVQRSVTPVVLDKKHNFLFGVLGVSSWSIGGLAAPLTAGYLAPVMFVLSAFAAILLLSAIFQFQKRQEISEYTSRVALEKKGLPAGDIPGDNRAVLLMLSLFLIGVFVILFNSSFLPILRRNLMIEETRISAIYIYLVAGSLSAIVLNKVRAFGNLAKNKYFWSAYVLGYFLLTYAINFIFIYNWFCAAMFLVGFLTGMFPGVVVSYVQDNFSEKDYNRMHSMGEFCLVCSGFLFWLFTKTADLNYLHMFPVFLALMAGHFLFVKYRVT